MALYLGKESTYERDAALMQGCDDEAVYIPQRECGDCGDYGEAIAALQQSVRSLDTEKQDRLVPGANIQINGNVISATDTTYEAGQNVTIAGNVISAKDTVYTAGDDSVIVDNVDHTIMVNREIIDDAVGCARYVGSMMYAQVANQEIYGNPQVLSLGTIRRDDGYDVLSSGIFTARNGGTYLVVLEVDLEWVYSPNGHSAKYRVCKASDLGQSETVAWNNGTPIGSTYGGSTGRGADTSVFFITLEEGENYCIMARDLGVQSGNPGAMFQSGGDSWLQVCFLGCSEGGNT